MKPLQTLLDNASSLFAQGLPSPEYRQVELYTKKKKLNFAAPLASDARLDGLADAQLAFFLLESHFAAQDPLLLEGKNSWERYLALPRQSTVDKIAAELYRLLRVCRIAGIHGGGRLEARDGLLRMSCNFKLCALDLNITPTGLKLLGGAVHAYLDSFRQPYSEAYVEALLLQYFFDIVGEVRKFADEDRVLYQFRQKYPFFNRHFRYDCDNPKVVQDSDVLHIEISQPYRDPVRYPIDFYLLQADAVFIVPVEALTDHSLAVADLPRWQAGVSDALLPASFAMRFAREDMIVGLPMT